MPAFEKSLDVDTKMATSGDELHITKTQPPGIIVTKEIDTTRSMLAGAAQIGCADTNQGAHKRRSVRRITVLNNGVPVRTNIIDRDKAIMKPLQADPSWGVHRPILATNDDTYMPGMSDFFAQR